MHNRNLEHNPALAMHVGDGMKATAETYTKRGIWALRAARVIAWNVLFEDATRFTFDRA